jgi:hypothetical protein
VILYVNRQALEKQLDETLPLYEKWDVKIETLPVDSTTVLKGNLPANGGQAVRIVRASR